MEDQELTRDIWSTKYRHSTDETSVDATLTRVGNAITEGEPQEFQDLTRKALHLRLWMPGGRIIAGAGTGNRVTLMNCYVNRQIRDSLDDIMQANSDAALTQQQGGGIGTHFGTIRPRGAKLRRTGAVASGPLPFMDMWDSMCATIKSAGGRRGAMMATINDTHPDLPSFIDAKHTKGRLTNFNVSVLVSDAFMAAVHDDEDWALYFPVEPAFERPTEIQEMDFTDDENIRQFVYSNVRARDLWDKITRGTYEYSEPGVIFIDRINDLNNLKYAETISCTNPCGEQPLPPNGACNLGAINLARIVKAPFEPGAEIDWSLLRSVTEIGVRFLDCVIDKTGYPLEAQEIEELNKRRIGLGVSGLANALAQLNLRYGSPAAAHQTEQIMQKICLAAYQASADLAIEKGPFPLFKPKEFFDSTFADQQLPRDLKNQIRNTGIRNGVLLTVAPTGTTSILYGNVSSGIEPVFAHKFQRKVNQDDGTKREYTAYDYNYLLNGGEVNAPQFVTADDLTVEQHIIMQAAVQRWVDASVSKTINVAQNTTFEDFQKVYDIAYTLGCKGTTTYRPSEVRGSVLSTGETNPSYHPTTNSVARRESILKGSTRKLRWPSLTSALYLTINEHDGKPAEVFFNSKDARFQEWMTALSLLITAILRKGDGDIDFIADELEAVHSVHDTAWMPPLDDPKGKPKHFGSLIAYIGHSLGRDFNAIRGIHTPTPPNGETTSTASTCPQCLARALVYEEGCKVCKNCSYSSC